MNKICKTCGSKIINAKRATKYCSIKCRPVSKPEKVTCLYCKKTFYVTKWRSKRVKFCSNRCKGLANLRQYNETRTGVCVQCGKEFTYRCNKNVIAKYCSAPCRKKAGYYSGSITIRCQQCGKKFDVYYGRRKAKFCSHACHIAKQRDKYHLDIGCRNGVRRSFKRKGLLTHCQECGYKEHPEILGVHHKDENSKNHSLDNLQVLCPICHSLKHHRHILHPTQE